MIKLAAKRIRDRNISWVEKFSERTEPTKIRYEKSLGYGSYHRWEGHDYTTNSDYYVVCSPARTKTLQKMYFAGIKKLPAIYKRSVSKVYSPYGKYFPNIVSALTHLNQKYGIPFPNNQFNYTSLHLQDIEIPRTVKA